MNTTVAAVVVTATTVEWLVADKLTEPICRGEHSFIFGKENTISVLGHCNKDLMEYQPSTVRIVVADSALSLAEVSSQFDSSLQKEVEAGDKKIINERLYGSLKTATDLIGPTLLLDIKRFSTNFIYGVDDQHVCSWSADLSGAELTSQYIQSDPPSPEELSAALSIVELHVTDVLRELPELASAIDSLTVFGIGAVPLISAVEQGVEIEQLLPQPTLENTEAEELFRALATESHEDRANNPGLPPAEVRDIVGSMCVLVETMRQLSIGQLNVVAISAADVMVEQLLRKARD